MKPIFESARVFQLWRALVSHQQVLLRSVKTASQPTRVDILFKSTKAVKLQTEMEGILIREADPVEVNTIANETGQLPDAECGFFVLESGEFVGYVIAGSLFTNEDEGEYSDPSALLIE